MIPRYSRPEMVAIWDLENKYKIWFEIEAHACDAMADIGIIPKNAPKSIWKKGKFDQKRIDEIEQKTKHDVIAFLTNLAENIGEDARFLHQGMTSSDVLDTCFSLQLKQASEILIKDIQSLLKELKIKAYETKDWMSVGRSHGIHAEPISFGLKFARFYAEMERGLARLEQAKDEISICKISGAVGTYANIDPRIEEYVAKKLGLKAESIATQVIPRDRYAFFFATIAIIASSIENIATEIRHLQRSEVTEVEEFFSSGQKGSSAMPHKRNPVLSENLTGLARYIRSALYPALENVVLWHERDISHSSVERITAPDTTIALDFALNRLISLIKNLVLYPDNVEKNLNKLGGLVFSQRILLALIEKGVSREDAYEIVQRNAMAVWKESGDFLAKLKQDNQVKKYLNNNELKELFNVEYYSKKTDFIFKKVFGNTKKAS